MCITTERSRSRTDTKRRGKKTPLTAAPSVPSRGRKTPLTAAASVPSRGHKTPLTPVASVPSRGHKTVTFEKKKVTVKLNPQGRPAGRSARFVTGDGTEYIVNCLKAIRMRPEHLKELQKKFPNELLTED